MLKSFLKFKDNVAFFAPLQKHELYRPGLVPYSIDDSVRDVQFPLFIQAGRGGL